jgi:hypothetical protein
MDALSITAYVIRERRMTTTTTPDLTEFFKYSRPKKPPCKVGVALGKLRGDTKTQLIAALATDNSIITNKAVITWIEKRVKDLQINTSNITSHRAKRCTCYDE